MVIKNCLDNPIFESETVLELIDLNEKKVLEVGCGLGLHASVLSKYTSEYVAIDKCEEKVKYISEKNLSSKINYIWADAMKMPFDDKIYDVVLMFHCIHEIPSIQQAKVILEAKRVLKSDGKLVIIETDTFVSSFQSCFDIIHENFLLYNHIHDLRHSYWLIDKTIENMKFKRIQIHRSRFDYSFDNIDILVNLLMENFEYEVDLNKNDGNFIKKELAKILSIKDENEPISLCESINTIVLKNN